MIQFDSYFFEMGWYHQVQVVKDLKDADGS